MKQRQKYKLRLDIFLMRKYITFREIVLIILRKL